MNGSTCQVFGLLIAIALLTFLTSLISLDSHLSANRGNTAGHKLVKRDKKVEKSTASEYVDYFKGKIEQWTGPAAKIREHSPDAQSYEADDEPETDDDDNTKSNKDEKESSQAGHRRPIPVVEKCTIKFEDKCKMNPIVKYWDDSTDCYVSPLKGISGLSAPLEDRRFIVFQADLGGWNNIRMGLEAVILFAQVTGRILVIPPPAVLYLLHFNKKWGDNKSTMEDFFDFSRLKLKNGLEVISMQEFLTMVAAPGLLSLPLPNNNTELSKGPLYAYLEKACYVRPWSPGKIFIGLNLTSLTSDHGLIPPRKVSSSGSSVDGGMSGDGVESENSIYGISMDDQQETEEGEQEKGDTETVDGLMVYGAAENDEEDTEGEGTEVIEGDDTNDDTESSAGVEDSPQVREKKIRAIFGTVNVTRTTADIKRIEPFTIDGKRTVLPYDYEFHQHRALYFPGHEENRLLTHFYSMLYFTSAQEEHRAKRYIRDRLRYHDQIFCTASIFIEKLMMLEEYHTADTRDIDKSVNRPSAERGWNWYSQDEEVLKIQRYSEEEYVNGKPVESVTAHTLREPKYVAFHIRRGDFQQKHTRLEAETIVEYTGKLVADRAQRIAYIATDEGNRSFFEPFFKEYKAVYFLNDIKNFTNIENINQNYIGMIEQVICANAHTFIGTPLSTFTAYITRMRGYMNRTLTVLPTDKIHFYAGQKYNKAAKDRVPALSINREGLYDRTYYFMKHHMFQLHTKPNFHLPLWIRDFVEAFIAIDDDTAAAVASAVSSQSSGQ